MSHNVQVNANKNDVLLPNGNTYTTAAAPQAVTLTDDEFAQISATAFSDGTLTDLGAAPSTGDAVVSQAVDVANVAALASVQIAAAPTQADYNALQADVANLHASVNALLANLRGSGRAMA